MHKELENLEEFAMNLLPGGSAGEGGSGEGGGTDSGGGTQK